MDGERRFSGFFLLPSFFRHPGKNSEVEVSFSRYAAALCCKFFFFPSAPN